MAAWELWPQHPAKARAFAEACDLPPLLGQTLLNRGMTTTAEARRFLSPSLDALDDPLDLPDMPAAMRRVRQAIAAKERIVLFGDSDVDGLTALTIVSEVLSAHGARVSVRVSNRVKDGYGFPAGLIPPLARAKIGLVVLLDCGSNQVEEVRAMGRAGIDVIIIDHHVPTRLAEPLALVNPYRGSGIGRELCTAGLALKFAQAWDADALERYVDVAAVGTLADYAPLVGENRMFIRAGLARLSRTPRPGLQRLCEAVRVTHASPEQVSRLLIPRLNAAGRLGDARAVWKLLTASTAKAVEGPMEQIGAAHAQTKRLYREMLGQAQDQASRLHFRDQYVMVVGRRGWHPGLVGPIAAQLTQRYGRPAIAIALEERVGVGSGRCSAPFNLFEALQACEPMLLRFGGHPRACGLTLESSKLEAFRDQINLHVHRLDDRQSLVRRLMVDAEATLAEMTPHLAASLERLVPFGAGHARPSVLMRDVTLESGKDGAWLTDGHRRVRVRGRSTLCAPREHYDVVASLHEVRTELAVSLAEVRLSSASGAAQAAGAPSSHGRI